jgi:hypothetical protein
MRRVKHVVTAAVATFALSLTTGCSLLAAAGNPAAIWAINDPANLQVVVRRADAALITTAEVNRLLTATPAGKDTPWIASVSPDPKEAAADIRALKNDPDYATTKARVVAVEVWMRTLPNVSAESGEHPSLLAAIDQSLADSYLAIGLKQAEIGSLKAQIETEKQAASADGVSPADKKSHEDKVDALKKQVDDADAAVDPLKKKFLGQIKDACAKLSNEDKARYAPAVANLLLALDDADVANSAAALKYPLVIKGLPDALKKVAPAMAMDVVEEQTGSRPNLANVKVNVSVSGGSPTITLDGLGDVGGLKPDDVVKETVRRSVAWFTHTLTLLATISTTKEKLTFERQTLNEMQAAFAPAAPSVVAVKIPAFDSPEVSKAAPAKLLSFAGMKHARASGGGPAEGAKTLAATKSEVDTQDAVVAEAKTAGVVGEKKIEGAKFGTKPGTKPGTKGETKGETKPGTKGESKPESKPPVKGSKSKK